MANPPAPPRSFPCPRSSGGPVAAVPRLRARRLGSPAPASQGTGGALRRRLKCKALWTWGINIASKQPI
ncbi:hypothetical protein PVAP13_3KG240554 [Panicum virgatum]|uniref:Uncharacterized protein n=1 Tax=Panicum virgatum TaxID=38727 RepID=A0A8T0V8H3_PANVG|nr:hypothetical protein PVAP13_3KG240554 [Panicum virgatum]